MCVCVCVCVCVCIYIYISNPSAVVECDKRVIFQVNFNRFDFCVFLLLDKLLPMAKEISPFYFLRIIIGRTVKSILFIGVCEMQNSFVQD